MRAYARSMLGDLFPARWGRLSFSQEGEDLLLEDLFSDQQCGRYVDIGSHHPYRFSNTYRFYRKGWSGLCVDPLPGTARKFSRARPRDIVEEVGISREGAKLTYYMLSDPALNTFDKDVAEYWSGQGKYRIIGKIEVQTFTLAELLSKVALPRIDFMSVDVEGLDLEVLSSNDWHRFRPRIIVAESLDTDLIAVASDPVVAYLAEQGYRPLFKTGRNVFFEAVSSE